MDTFTVGLRSPWCLRALGRNPLIRLSDRIEAVVLVVAVIFTVVAIPVAATIGRSVHEALSRTYSEEARTRHQVIATAVEQGQAVPRLREVAFSAEAKWSYAGRSHRGVIAWPAEAKANATQTIWVNRSGENVAPPTPLSRVPGRAIAAASLAWLGVAEASAALVYLVRRRLNHTRYRQWEREMAALRDNDGRRNSRS